MDWHSSGITTSVLGALKRGLAPVQWELGLHVCGGRGNESRKTPGELTTLSDRPSLDGDALARASRLVAATTGSRKASAASSTHPTPPSTATPQAARS